MLDWMLENICINEVDEVILAVNYLADVLKHRVGNKRGDVDIHYSLESKPLGTGGPLKNSEERLKKGCTFLTMNGDILAEMPLKEMHEFHSNNEATVTVALHKVKDPSRFGVAEIDDGLQIKKFIEKPKIDVFFVKLVLNIVYMSIFIQGTHFMVFYSKKHSFYSI